METTSYPSNPIEAVTHPDPYPYYAELVQQRPFYYDETLGVWVAASAEIVKAALTHPRALVRPASEPVPRHLVGSPSGEIFGKLVRMNDGQFHRELKPAVTKALAELNLAFVTHHSHKFARLLVEEFKAEPGALTKLAFQLPVYVVGSLLGINDAQLPLVYDWLKDFVQGLANPSGKSEQPDRPSPACLLEIFNTLTEKIDKGSPNAEDTLFFRLAHKIQATGSYDRTVIVANAIGFLSQTFEATAGLIGNSVLALAAQPEIQARVKADLGLVQPLVQEVLRYDPPIQNTRRFIAEGCTLAEENLKAGDTVLVLLSAANRDPASNLEPHRFDLFRETPQTFSFGSGIHACPGHSLAELIAKVAIEELSGAGLLPETITGPVRYRPSVNARIPVL